MKKEAYRVDENGHLQSIIVLSRSANRLTLTYREHVGGPVLTGEASDFSVTPRKAWKLYRSDNASALLQIQSRIASLQDRAAEFAAEIARADSALSSVEIEV